MRALRDGLLRLFHSWFSATTSTVTVEFLRRSLQVGPPQQPQKRERKANAVDKTGTPATNDPGPGGRLVKKMTSSNSANSGESSNM